MRIKPFAVRWPVWNDPRRQMTHLEASPATELFMHQCRLMPPFLLKTNGGTPEVDGGWCSARTQQAATGLLSDGISDPHISDPRLGPPFPTLTEFSSLGGRILRTRVRVNANDGDDFGDSIHAFSVFVEKSASPSGKPARSSGTCAVFSGNPLNSARSPLRSAQVPPYSAQCAL